MNKVILNKKYADWTINTSAGNHGSVDSHIFSRFLSSELMGLWLLTFVTLISEENIFFLDKRKTKFFIRNCKSFLSSEMYLNYSNIQNKMGIWAGNIKNTSKWQSELKNHQTIFQKFWDIQNLQYCEEKCATKKWARILAVLCILNIFPRPIRPNRRSHNYSSQSEIIILATGDWMVEVHDVVNRGRNYG